MGRWELAIEPSIPSQALPLRQDGVLQTWPGQSLSVEGEGYLRRSTVDIYVMSTPILVGSATTDATGAFGTSITIPDSMRLGTHTIQVIGTNPGNELSRASLGLLVAAQPNDATAVVSPIGTRIGFVKKGAAVNKRSIVALQSLMGQIPDGSQANMARVVISAPKATKRGASKALAKKRAAGAVRALRSVGYDGPVTTRIKSKKVRQAGTTVVTVWFAPTPE
jgi:hypothetical protein